MDFTPAAASLLAGLMFTALLVFLLLDNVGGERGVSLVFIVLVSVASLAFTFLLVAFVATDYTARGRDAVILYWACFAAIGLEMFGIFHDIYTKRKVRNVAKSRGRKNERALKDRSRLLRAILVFGVVLVLPFLRRR